MSLKNSDSVLPTKITDVRDRVAAIANAFTTLSQSLARKAEFSGGSSTALLITKIRTKRADFAIGTLERLLRTPRTGTEEAALKANLALARMVRRAVKNGGY